MKRLKSERLAFWAFVALLVLLLHNNTKNFLPYQSRMQSYRIQPRAGFSLYELTRTDPHRLTVEQFLFHYFVREKLAAEAIVLPAELAGAQGWLSGSTGVPVRVATYEARVSDQVAAALEARALPAGFLLGHRVLLVSDGASPASPSTFYLFLHQASGTAFVAPGSPAGPPTLRAGHGMPLGPRNEGARRPASPRSGPWKA